MNLDVSGLPDDLAEDIGKKIKRNLDLEYKMNKLVYAEWEKEAEDDDASEWENKIYTFHDEVTDESAGKCIEALGIWSRKGAEEIKINMTSPGGLCTAGFALHDYIRELRREGIHFEIVGYGQIMSMASVIIQAADWRVMMPNAVFMMHNVVWTDYYIQYEDIPMLEDDLKWDKVSERMGNKIIADRSGWDEEDLFNFVNRRRVYLTAQQALEQGFIDEVREI